MKKLIVIVVVVLLLGIWLGRNVHAQAAAPYQVGVSTATHTSCAVTAGQTWYCFAADGLWVSINGAAYVQVQMGPVVAGVTSWNGQVGAVVYTAPAPPAAPVTSVNGKTGAVVLALQ